MKDKNTMASDLVFHKDKEERVAHISIADGMGVSQDSALKLIKKYKDRLSELGRVRFEIVPFLTKGGPQKKKVYVLNRSQAMFLITLMRNNEKTVDFKLELIQAFNAMEDWIRQRLENSIEYKLMSDTLREVRTISGKETRPHHFSNEARLVNWALTGKFFSLDRESLSADELDLLLALQQRNSVLIGAGMQYRDRKESLRLFCELRKSKEAA